MKLVDRNGKWPTEEKWGYGGTVHQAAIDRALPFLSQRDRMILKQQQLEVDRDQSLGGSFKHAMRAPGQSIADAKNLANEFVRGQLSAAMYLITTSMVG